MSKPDFEFANVGNRFDKSSQTPKIILNFRPPPLFTVTSLSQGSLPMRVRYFFPALLFGFAAIGCTESSGGREAVSGTITLDGKPLDQGVISFIPYDPDAPTRASAAIENGSYAIPKAQGLAPGKYKVAISSPDGKTPAATPDALPGPSGNFASKQRIPDKFNEKSTLEVEVKQGTSNKFDFTIP